MEVDAEENAVAADGPGCHEACAADGCWYGWVGVGAGAPVLDCQGCPGAHDESACHDGPGTGDGWLGWGEKDDADDGGGGGIGIGDDGPGRPGTAGAAATGSAS